MKAPRITAKELKAKLDSGAPVTIIDVRNDTDYSTSKEKIPGAIRIRSEEIEARLSELDRAKEAVAYCT